MLYNDSPKTKALVFLDTRHMRAGRPHPDEAYETALINRDADFVLKYVEYTVAFPSATPDYFWYFEYAVSARDGGRYSTDNHAEFMAKFGAPKS